jgi:hypothetical protein
LLIFTDFSPDDFSTFSGLNFKFNAGWSMIACLVTNLAINFSFMLREVILKAKNFFRNRLMKSLKIKQTKMQEEQKVVEEEIKR